MDQVRKYSQDEVNVELGGRTITGFTDDGTVIAPVNPSKFAVEGANGEIGVAVRKTRLFVVTFNLMHTSLNNADLAFLFGDFNQLFIRDNLGEDQVRGIAWGETIPELGYAKELAPRVFVFNAQLELVIGGNVVAAPIAA